MDFFDRNARIHERATSVMGGLFFFSYFFFYTTHGSWGSTRGRRKHLVLRKKKKNDGGGGAGLEGERREGFTVPGVAQILRQRNTRERLR